jgi:hypothetical protein
LPAAPIGSGGQDRLDRSDLLAEDLCLLGIERGDDPLERDVRVWAPAAALGREGDDDRPGLAS